MKPRRIYILGTAGSGKTTLANQIPDILKIRVYDLDDIFWIKKYTKKRTVESMKKGLNNLLKKNKKWIIEGIYTDWSNNAIKKADLIVWINTPKHIISWRIFKRYIQRRKDKRETLRDCINLIKYARSYKEAEGTTSYQAHKKVIKKHRVNFIIINNKKDIKNLIEMLR